MTEPTLFDDMVDQVMFTIRDAFLELWERPDASQHLEGFLDRRVVFAVTRDGIDVLIAPEKAA